ncbi:hypothetical protein BN1012_Phect2058 [Candidatus Phaeomarinobacter ectocarpi]|uniref:Uncharacterized protein n=1 Tax=Candidatus Phaeomarinibacter ectocarpi TaxID=1458461 RepID=X5MNP2_9HYPH|nr:hypothetical protein [Candidatus Phaeomarinobacter ectocarpi]CDO60271.1 hypothetical protein BN1012_Phect2058 [Candidatus Phaeomarinobacter ectocarpi]
MTDHDYGDLAGAGFGDFELSNLDQALFLIQEYDLEAQLIAIRGVLSQNRAARQLVIEDIEALNEQMRNRTGGDDEYHMHMENHWADTLHGTVFQDAAHSMSAVGMLAPFVESLFVSIFSGLRTRQQHDDDNHRTRGVRRARSETDFWDPHFVFDKKVRRKDLVAGIGQLSASVGLAPFLPANCDKALTALFAYRNKMFHNGFEWPMEERHKFGKRIENEAWPEGWFTQSNTGGEPWIFYMSDDFIKHCLKMIDQVLHGVGEYLEQGRSEQT